MNRNNRNQLIQSYLNLIEQNNHQINQNTQLMHSHEQTLNRLIFENQVPQNYRNGPTPIFFNRQSSQRPMTSTNNQFQTGNNRLWNIFRQNRFQNQGTNNLENIPLFNFDTLLDSFLDPVQVSPSQEQIDNAVINTTFNEIEHPQNVTCPISLIQFNPNDEVSKILHCGHLFIKDELIHWFQHNSRCPLCRYDIRTYPMQQPSSSSSQN